MLTLFHASEHKIITALYLFREGKARNKHHSVNRKEIKVYNMGFFPFQNNFRNLDSACQIFGTLMDDRCVDGMLKQWSLPK